MNPVTGLRGRVAWSDDRGGVDGTFALPLGFLIFVVGMLMVLNLWSVINTKAALNAAARQAAHAVSEAKPLDARDVEGEVYTEARTVAATTLETFLDRRPDPSEVGVHLDVDGDGRWRRCGVVVVTVSYRAPLVRVPIVGDLGSSWSVSAKSSALVDPYRDGVTVTGECP